MAASVQLGDVFLLPIPSFTFRHIFVIVTAVDKKTSSCIGVPIDTFRNKRIDDRTVVFQPGCHPFITKQSYVNYEKALILNQEDFENEDVRKLVPLSSDLLNEVLEGMLKTPRLKYRIREIYFNSFH